MLYGVLIPVVGSVALFAFLSVLVWSDARRREREAYYQYEFRRRLVEAGKLDGEDVKEMIQFEHDAQRANVRRGLQVGGAIVASAGLGLCIGLRFIQEEAVWMVGYIPLAVGLGMLAIGMFAGSTADEPRLGGSRRDSV